MNDLGALLADFSGDELDGVETNNATALLSPESVSAARAESAEDTGSKSGEIGAQAVKAGIGAPSVGSNDVDQPEVHFSEGDGGGFRSSAGGGARAPGCKHPCPSRYDHTRLLHIAGRYGRRWTGALRLSGGRWLAHTLHMAVLLEKRLELALEAL